MESILIYALIILFILCFGYLFMVTTDKVDKIHFSLRYILTLPYSLIAFVLLGLVIRLLIMIASLFWSEDDTVFNIYIISYTLLPFITSYAFVNASSYMIPNYKITTAITLSVLVISIHFYIYYLSFSDSTIIFGDNLLDLYGLKRGSFGEIVYLLSVIIGISFAIKHSKNQDSFIGLEE